MPVREDYRAGCCSPTHVTMSGPARRRPSMVELTKRAAARASIEGSGGRGGSGGVAARTGSARYSMRPKPWGSGERERALLGAFVPASTVGEVGAGSARLSAGEGPGSSGNGGMSSGALAASGSASGDAANGSNKVVIRALNRHQQERLTTGIACHVVKWPWPWPCSQPSWPCAKSNCW